MAEEVTPTPAAPQAPAPQASEGLSPSEQRYFESKGADVPGERDPAPAESTPAKAEATDAEPPKPEIPPTDPAKTWVEKGALDSERNRRKKAEQALMDVNARFAALEARLAPPPQQQQAPLPSIEEDPISHLKRIAQTVEQSQQAQQQEAQIVTVLQRSDALEKEYAAEQPDYNEALDYLRSQLLAEAQVTGVPHHLAMQQIKMQAANTAHMAMQQGRNPGDVFYAFAKARGWPGKQPAAAPAQPQAPAAPAATPQQQNAAREALAMLERGQAASPSLSAAPGRSADGTSLADIAGLDGDDFLKAWGRVEKMQRAGRA